MRILFRDNLGIRNLNVGKHFDNLLFSLLLRHPLVNHERLADLPLYRKNGVKARHGLLENNGYRITAHFVHLFN